MATATETITRGDSGLSGGGSPVAVGNCRARNSISTAFVHRQTLASRRPSRGTHTRGAVVRSAGWRRLCPSPGPPPPPAPSTAPPHCHVISDAPGVGWRVDVDDDGTEWYYIIIIICRWAVQGPNFDVKLFFKRFPRWRERIVLGNFSRFRRGVFLLVCYRFWNLRTNICVVLL